jgi:hypothetical protein
MSRRRRNTWILTALGIVVSLFLLHYAYWLYLIRQANFTLQQEQNAALATSRYARAVSFTPPLVSSVPLLRNPLREALLKQVQLLYAQQRGNEALEFVQVLPSRYPFLERDWEYHFWYGNSLFLRAILQEDPQALGNDLQGAVREFQTALELNPRSWDARFNYELIKQALLDEGEQGAQQLKLLLEEKPREDRREDELPPEKVG